MLHIQYQKAGVLHCTRAAPLHHLAGRLWQDKAVGLFALEPCLEALLVAQIGPVKAGAPAHAPRQPWLMENWAPPSNPTVS